MAPSPRVSRSTFSPRVTLYEPPSASASSTATPPRRSARSPVKKDESPAAASPRARAPRVNPEPGPEEVKPELVKAEETKPSPKKTPAKPKPFKRYLDTPHPEPKRWREAFEIIREQRKRLVAPVDTMGCEAGGTDAGDVKAVSEIDRRLSTIVSLMMSSQTKDPVTHQATKNLRNNLPGGLSLEGLLAATEEDIDEQICKVGFHKTKAMNLKKLAVRLRDLHGGDVPDDLDDLLAINGVGPKMAFLYLQSIGQNAGIGVDTHVHRITHRLRWHRVEPKTPEETRLNLESWLPKEHHKEINHMLVGFGQMICKPLGPACDRCEVAKVPGLCPSRRRDLGPYAKREEEEAGGPKVEVEVEAERVKGEEGEVSVELKVEETVVKQEGAVKREGIEERKSPRKRVKVEQDW